MVNYYCPECGRLSHFDLATMVLACEECGLRFKILWLDLKADNETKHDANPRIFLTKLTDGVVIGYKTIEDKPDPTNEHIHLCTEDAKWVRRELSVQLKEK